MGNDPILRPTSKTDTYHYSLDLLLNVLKKDVWKKLVSFTSYSEIEESVPDRSCARVCLTEDITDGDIVILDNCRSFLPCQHFPGLRAQVLPRCIE